MVFISPEESSITGDLTIDGTPIVWQPGDDVRLFFSYSHTSARFDTVLRRYGLKLMYGWEGAGHEERVYVVGKR